MTTTSKRIAAAVAISLLAFGAYFLFAKGDGKTEEVSEKAAEPVQTTPSPKRARAESKPAPAAPSMPTQVDDDPVGDLFLQGQVVDDDGHGVSGARVILGSAPSRTTVSEEDGSFSFDKLVQRRYSISARSSDQVGGPVIVTLSEKSDPVVIHMHAGGGIRVQVVDQNEEPIASARVLIPALDSVADITDSQGVVEIRNLPPGSTMLSAQADGFAKAHVLANVPRGEDKLEEVRIRLQRGVPVSGMVVDEDGKPVANASVIALAAGALMQVEDPRRDGVKSDTQGRFSLPAVASGSFQVLAMHDLHAPSTSERFHVSDSEVRGITVTLRKGASLQGRVVSASGEAVAWATVRVRTAPGSVTRARGVNRQMISDESGVFEFQGLPQQEVVLYGSTDSASSQSLQVDLRSTSKTKDLELVLDIDGSIEGIVVDENGEAVAEAQVSATPDFWDGADMMQMVVRGPAFATSRGDGSFTIRGLPVSKYKIRASRGTQNDGGAFQQGVSAETGAKSVRVVLATPGTIVGKIRATDGSTPTLATVSIGWGKSVPVRNGNFHLSSVSPNSYEITVRGPDFASTFLADVEVKAGQEKDVGTIKVNKGRKVSGRVLDGSGAPVEGAEVVLAKQLISEGANLTPKQMGTAMDEQLGTRRTKSDSRGSYSLRGLGESELTIAADHPDGGRSLGLTVPKGGEDVALDLNLLPVGSVKGTVTVNGEPSAGVDILLTSETGSAHIIIVKSDERGAFWAERVASGNVKVSAMIGSGASSSMVATNIIVKPGEQAIATLEVEQGSISFSVQVAGENDAKIDAAQVFLFRGAADVRTGGELNRLFLSEASSAKMGFAMGTGSAKFDKVTPASYSVCIIPINGDMNDPSFAQKLQRHVDEIAVYCQQLKITETPAEQSYKAIVPPMTPLPDD